MKSYLSEADKKDELVKIIATDWQRLLDGFAFDRVQMPKEVVYLSEAIDTIEEFLAEVEAQGSNRRSWNFYVRACKDDFLLFSYDKDGIAEDYREEERPKNPERAYLVMRDSTKEYYYYIGNVEETYTEFAVRDMEKLLKSFDEKKQRGEKEYKEVLKENIYIDVYKEKSFIPHGYLYSYKDGKKYVRELTEEEKENEKEWADRIARDTTTDSAE